MSTTDQAFCASKWCFTSLGLLEYSTEELNKLVPKYISNLSDSPDEAKIRYFQEKELILNENIKKLKEKHDSLYKELTIVKNELLALKPNNPEDFL